MSTGHVEYASLNGTHIFKLIGEVRAQSCISLDKLLNRNGKLVTTHEYINSIKNCA
jgi:hypothetical protein